MNVIAPGRPGYLPVEALPALSVPAAKLERGPDVPDYFGRVGTIGTKGTGGAWAADGQTSFTAGKSLPAAIAAAQQLSKSGEDTTGYPLSATAVLQGKDGSYILAPTFSWSGNPESADSGESLHVTLGDEFKFSDPTLVAFVDTNAWVHLPDVKL